MLRGSAVVGGTLGVLFAGAFTWDQYRLRLGDCPSPGGGRELSSTARRVDEPLVEPVSDLVLVTADDEAAALQVEQFPDSTRAFVEETDFADAFLLGVQPPDSVHSKNPHFTGVERLDDGTVHSYSCSTRRSGSAVRSACAGCAFQGSNLTRRS